MSTPLAVYRAPQPCNCLICLRHMTPLPAYRACRVRASMHAVHCVTTSPQGLGAYGLRDQAWAGSSALQWSAAVQWMTWTDDDCSKP